MDLGFIIAAISVGILVVACVIFCWENRYDPARDEDPNPSHDPTENLISKLPPEDDDNPN